VDLLGCKRRARGFFPLDNWGGSSSNDGGSSTSSSGSGEGSTGGGGYSLGGISPGSNSSSSSYTSTYQEPEQPPDNPAPVVVEAPPPDPGPLEALNTEKPSAPEGADSLTGKGATGLITKDGFTVLRTLASVLSGPAGIFSIVKSFFDGSFDSLKANAPAWTRDADFNASRYTTRSSGAASAGGGASTSSGAASAGGGASTNSAPAARVALPALTASRMEAMPKSYDSLPLLSGYDYQPGQFTQFGDPSAFVGNQTTTSNQDGLAVALLAGLAVLAFT
jgi:hypothetical protein